MFLLYKIYCTAIPIYILDKYVWNTSVQYTGTNVKAFLELFYNLFTVSPVYELRKHKDKSRIASLTALMGQRLQNDLSAPLSH